MITALLAEHFICIYINKEIKNIKNIYKKRLTRLFYYLDKKKLCDFFL